jgi:hypothetical protein
MQSVESLIAGLPYKHQPAVQQLRALILKADPGIVETVKWGTPVYSRGRNLLTIAPQADHVNLQLWDGAALAEKHKCIKGNGESMRHVKIPYEGKVNYERIGRVICDALKRTPTQ